MRLSFDLHLHSCLSPCGGAENTPADLAAMCALAGLDVVALTDHNTAGNCGAFLRAAERHGLLALPGMELTTREEVHIVCLFPDLPSAVGFDARIKPLLPPIPNNPGFFGPQLLMDDTDRILGEESAFLAGAAEIGIYEVAGLTAQYGGTAFPAHIDRPSFSLLSNLGFWDANMNFPLAELSPHSPPALLLRPDLSGVTRITNSDAHYLDQVMDAHQYMDLPQRSPKAVIHWLKTAKNSDVFFRRT